MPSLVGDIQERESKAPRSTQDASLGTPRNKANPETGFPQAQHRSQSAFARAREARRNAPPKSDDTPVVQPTTELSVAGPSTATGSPSTHPPAMSEEELRAEISSQNEKRVLEMSDSEREREREEIIERFGPGIVELMQRVKRRRGRPVWVSVLSHPAQLTDPSDATVKSPSQEDNGKSYPAFLEYSSLFPNSQCL